MSSLEKLVKAFEALRVFQPESSVLDPKKKEQTITKKDKISNCSVIAECICSTNLKGSADFAKFLGVSVETFLMLCDDSESDVRIVADECLNKTIKTLIETNLNRLQVELYKEIKKNGNQRSLRAALWRFSDMCHLIRPQKCRPYVTNLLPCLARICRRPEEAIQETLAQAMAKLCPVLLGFTNDNEIKLLLKAFLSNLRSSLATARRTAASSLTLICTHARKTPFFCAYLLTTLLDILIPVNLETESYTVLGVLLALRHLLPLIAKNSGSNLTMLQESSSQKSKDVQQTVKPRQLIQVFELLLYYLDHGDHNVITASLETLQQLMKTPPPDLLPVFTTSGLLVESTIQGSFSRDRAESQGKLPTLPDETMLEDDLDTGSEVDSSQKSGSSIAITVGSGSNLSELDSTAQDSEATDPENPEALNGGADIELLEMEGAENAYSGIDIGSVSEDKETLEDSEDKLQAAAAAVKVDTLEVIESGVDSMLKKGVSDDKITSADENMTSADIDISDVMHSRNNSNSDVTTIREGDIGTLFDADAIPLEFVVRLLCSKFLLTGNPQGLRADRQVRVSVKALSLGCLAGLVSIHPQAFLIKLHKSSRSKGELQDVKDSLLFAMHGDPQIKGTVALLIGNLIQVVLVQASGNFSRWVAANKCKDFLKLDDMVAQLNAMLVDESSQATRLAIIALKVCLTQLLNSRHAELGLKILLQAIGLHSNPYWLVRVGLCELLSELDFKVVSYLESLCQHHINDTSSYHIGLLNIQDKVLNDVVLHFIGDDDLRVRSAAASALVNMIPRLFYAVDCPQQDAMIALAKQHSARHLEPIMHEYSAPLQPAVHGLVAPYDCGDFQSTVCASSEASLSRVIYALIQKLNMSTSKHLTTGCLHAFSLLAEKYQTTLYTQAWSCAFAHGQTPGSARPFSVHGSQGAGLLSLLVSIMTSSPVAMDSTAHSEALRAAGNVFAGAAMKGLQNGTTNTTNSTNTSTNTSNKPTNSTDPTDDSWHALTDRSLVPIAQALLVHVTRLLSICSHVLEEQVPGPPQTPRTTLPSLPNAPSLSPMKRKGKTGVKEDGGQSGSVPGQAERNSSKDGNKDGEKDRGKKEAMGLFYNYPHYVKIYDILKSVNDSYMISLDLARNEKLGTLLRAALTVLSQMLEVASLSEVGRHAEELLGYLKSAMSREHTVTVTCVQQLLKALFGTNLSSQWEGGQDSPGTMGIGGSRLTLNIRPGLYHCCFTAPYTQFTQCLASATFRATAHTEQDENTWVHWVRRRAERKVPAVLKPGSTTDKGTIANYIRLFEPLVIKSLKQYTMTSDVKLQKQVLNLLIQLVHLRVNYCLLDSEQIFIGFVIKQFEFIEEGQIRCSSTLVPDVFNFLVLLSYERYHSKTIIGFPKIIQLCDGIMASGQDPATHAIPALQSIVLDLFVVRASSKPTDVNKDMDTQREVLISMLLKLIHHYQILEMFILVLHQSRKESEEKWKRLSRQVTDKVLPLLARQQLCIDTQPACDVVHRLFEVVAPSVFRPVDILLKTLFSQPYDLTSVGIARWLGLVLALLRVLISQSKEETVLARLKELSLSVHVTKHLLVSRDSRVIMEDGDDDSVQDMGQHRQGWSADETFARFLFQVVGMVVTEIQDQFTSLPYKGDANKFLCQELAHLLLYMMHMFQSGMFRRVAYTSMQLFSQPAPDGFFSMQEISSLFKDILSHEPTLTLQWCNILILLNCDDQNFWSDVMLTNKRYVVARPRCNRSDSVDVFLTKTRSCTQEITRRGALVLYCDFVCENLNDVDKMTWVILNHVNDLILLSTEPPVQDFIGALHRNSAASGLLLQAINSRCEIASKPSLVKQLLSCVEGVHQSQSGALVVLLLDKFLDTPHLTVARQCDMTACRRLEMLLTENLEDARQQLSIEDLNKLINDLVTNHLHVRHERLYTLLNKVKVTLYGKDGGKNEGQPHVLLESNRMDKEVFERFASQCCTDTKHMFSQTGSTRDCARLLQHLSYSSILSIIMHKEFELSILRECLQLGLRLTVDQIQASHATPSPPQLAAPPADDEPRPLHDLYRATQVTLFRHVNSVINTLPVPHQMFVPEAVSRRHGQAEYHEKLLELFSHTSWLETVFPLAELLLEYLLSLRVLPWKPELPSDAVKDVARFSIVCLEIIYWQLVRNEIPSFSQLHTSLQLLAAVLQNPNTQPVIGQREQVTWVCTAIRTVHQIMSSLLILPGEKLVRMPNQDSSTEDSQQSPVMDDSQYAVRACDEISELVQCLRTYLTPHATHSKLPAFLTQPLTTCIIGLARMSVVSSYARTPPLVWRLGWMPSPCGDAHNTQLPPVPLEYLQERDVLAEFIYRVNTIGWTSRQQFEETWMGLLGVLNPVSQGNLGQPVSPEEEVERTQCVVLATRGITALLVQSLLTPVSGDPCSSSLEYRPRDKSMPFLHTRVGQKLAFIRGIVQSELDYLAWERRDASAHTHCDMKLKEAEPHNYLYVQGMERERSQNYFGLAQLSIDSIWNALGLLDNRKTGSGATSSPNEPPSQPQDTQSRILPRFNKAKAEDWHRSTRDAGLDIHSCLQLLLDLYGQILTPLPTSPATPLAQLNETLKSVVCLSDVFVNKQQYEWMLNTLLEVNRVHTQEDELAMQYIVTGVCKAVAIVGVEASQSEKITKLIELHLRSTHLPTKMASVYGTLHLLEAGMTEITTTVLPHVTEYLTRTLASITPTTIHSEHHVMLMWACALYICENCGEEVKDAEFVPKVLQTAITCVSAKENVTALGIYLEVMNGLERLVLAHVLTSSDVDVIVKMAVDRLASSCPQRSLAALGLILTCMYSGKQNDHWTPTAVPDAAIPLETGRDPESLIVAMEKVNLLFDRMRRGCEYEARVLSRVLPHFLTDFFPPQDIMNKIIGEFLSSQQPHPRRMAHVIFKVFEKLLSRGEQSLLREWVMLSLSNFTQRTPVAMAVWSLTAFFMCASSNTWLRALFPYVMQRMGRLEPEDEQIFLIAALDFASQLASTSTQSASNLPGVSTTPVESSALHTFQVTFQQVSHLTAIYARVVERCQQISQHYLQDKSSESQ